MKTRQHAMFAPPAPLRLLALLCLLPAAAAVRDAGAAAPSRPNIVLIVSDDQSYTDFGFMGNAQVHTPHLDRLARRSARYVNGYVPSSVCRPSLVTLLTGLYPHQHGVHFNHPPPGFARLTRSPEIDRQRYDALRGAAERFIRQVPTLPRVLQQHGYRCLQTGKFWEGHWRNAGFTHGMTTGRPSGGAHGDKQLASGDVVAHGNGDHGLIIGRQTMQPIYDFIDDCGTDPFLVWYAPLLPHTPHDAPQRYVDLYHDAPDIARHQVPYYAAISQFDDTVGQLLRFIDRRGLTDRTVVVFIVDNGWQPDPEGYVASRNEWDPTHRSKRSPFEAGLRTPVLICWSGHTRAATHQEPVSSIDVLPTLLSAAGVAADSLGLPGANLMPSALGTQPLPADRAVFGEIYPGDATVLGDPARDIAYRWVRQGNLKLIVPHAPQGRPPWNDYLRQPALYDLAADPVESRNLIDHAAYQDAASDLRRRLDAWWSPAADDGGPADAPQQP